EHGADGDADVVRTGPSENRHPQRDAAGPSQQEWPQPTPAQRVPQFPDRDALHHQTEGDDQRRGLHRRKDVQPNAGGNQSEGKPCHPRDKRGGKRCRQINGSVDDRSVHRSLILSCPYEWQISPSTAVTFRLRPEGRLLVACRQTQMLHWFESYLLWEHLFKAVLKG